MPRLIVTVWNGLTHHAIDWTDRPAPPASPSCPATWLISDQEAALGLKELARRYPWPPPGQAQAQTGPAVASGGQPRQAAEIHALPGAGSAKAASGAENGSGEAYLFDDG